MKRIIGLIWLVLLAAIPACATVSTETTRVAYTCNGVLTSYAYPFKVLADGDLLVVKKATATATSAETTLVLNTDYTVTGAGTSGGNVVLTAGSKCGSGYTLAILRNMAATQTTDYVDGEAFSAESLETALDKATLVLQQQKEQIGRAPKLPKTSTITDIALPNPTASNYIGWNAAATGLENKSAPVITTATQYEVDALISYGGGTSYTQATIEAALAAIGTTNKATLLLRPGTWVISSNADWSAYTNVTLKIVPGAVISHGSYTIALPNQQVVAPEMFGLTPGPIAYSSAGFVGVYNSVTNKNMISTDAPYVVDSSVVALGTNASATVYDGFLYVCEYGNSSIAIYSLKNPAVPVLIQRLALAAGAAPRGIRVKDDIGYVVNHGTHTIQLIDLGSKTSAVSLATFAIGRSNPKDIAINGNDLYVVMASGYVQKWTIDGRDIITKRYENTTSTTPLTVAIINDCLYVGCADGNINFFTLASLGSKAVYAIDTWISFLDGRGDIMYAVDYQTGKLYTFDISTITPVTLSTLDTSPNPSTCRIVGNKLYIPCLTSPAYLDVFDISVPSAPVRLYKLTLNTGMAGFMAFYKKYAYITGHSGPLTVDVIYTGNEYVEDDYVQDKKNRSIGNYLRDHTPFRNTITKIANYEVLLGDDIIRVGLGAQITLPVPAINWTGKTLHILNVHETTSSLVTDGTDVWTLPPRSSRSFVCDGAQWDTLSSHSLTVMVNVLCSGASPTVVLTADEAEGNILQFYGSPTGGVTITVPLYIKQWTIYNNTGINVTVIGVSGTGVTIATSKRAIVYSDGTNVVRVTPDT